MSAILAGAVTSFGVMAEAEAKADLTKLTCEEFLPGASAVPSPCAPGQL
jgi:hypothetical protein